MEEVQAMPPVLSSIEDFPTVGLSELGQRLITTENEPAKTTKVKVEEPLPTPPSSAATTKQGKKEEKKPSTTPTPPNKKVRISNDLNGI